MLLKVTSLLPIVVLAMVINSASVIYGKQETAIERSIGVIHEVKPGETLFRINRKYYLSGEYRHLAEFNSLDPNQSLKAGSELHIPNPVILDMYTVKPGDTLYSITTKYFNRDTYLQYVAEFNAINDPDLKLLEGFDLRLPLPSGIHKHIVKSKETLYGLTGKYFKHKDFEDFIAQFNSVSDPASDVKAGSTLMIPNPFRSKITLSEEERFTIEIDKKKNKLHLIANNAIIRSFSIASGKQQDLTPTGTFKIVNKLKEPWYAAKNIRGGDPKNPLGSRWLGLNALHTDGTKYGIHGTNDSSSIGRYSSSGCVRMRNNDVEWLYDHVPIGTKVVIKD